MVTGAEAGWPHRIFSQEAGREQEVKPGYKTSGWTPIDVLPSASLYLLIAPQLSQIVPPVVDHVFKHMSVWFHIQTTTVGVHYAILKSFLHTQESLQNFLRAHLPFLCWVLGLTHRPIQHPSMLYSRAQDDQRDAAWESKLAWTTTKHYTLALTPSFTLPLQYIHPTGWMSFVPVLSPLVSFIHSAWWIEGDVYTVITML